MWTLISVRLAKWQASFILGWTAMVVRLLGPFLPPVATAARKPSVHPSANHHHTVEEHAVPGLWLMAPRATIALWSAGAVVALVHHLHLSGRPNSAFEIRRLGG